MGVETKVKMNVNKLLWWPSQFSNGKLPLSSVIFVVQRESRTRWIDFNIRDAQTVCFWHMAGSFSVMLHLKPSMCWFIVYIFQGNQKYFLTFVCLWLSSANDPQNHLKTIISDGGNWSPTLLDAHPSYAFLPGIFPYHSLIIFLFFPLVNIFLLYSANISLFWHFVVLLHLKPDILFKPFRLENLDIFCLEPQVEIWPGEFWSYH